MVQGVPYIDTSISDIGVSQLRKLNATDLRKGKKTLVVRDNNEPLAVVLRYEQFLVMQHKLEAAIKTVALLTKGKDVEAVMESLKDAAEGRGVDLSEIAPELAKRE
jgi:PHD/YefM family antitoxin component YafN of YafNO toxin-antitoxin module